MTQTHINIAMLAHVDAGKTTLSEALLYKSGSIRKAGRVDNKDAFLDTNEMERNRGITIFSKQAVFSYGGCEFTLLDTPGHVDFSAEMERTLQVLDYAVLIISGADGVQGHTRTLWRLLARYNIPAFIFVNKMDQQGTDHDKLLAQIKDTLGSACVDFSKNTDGTYLDEDFYENVAVCNEKVLETYLEGGSIGEEDIRQMIQKRELFPCFFGSALKMDGIDELLAALSEYTKIPDYPEKFGATVFKITRDAGGSRLTHLKVTGGTLKARNLLTGYKQNKEDDIWEEKVNQIRIYSGEKFETQDEVKAGTICAVTGLSYTYPGEGLGIQTESELPILEPVLTYELILPEGVQPQAMMPKLTMLEEEDPELHIVWNEQLQEIKIQIMGEVQIEILKALIFERFGVEVEFGTGKILYRETIADTVEGVGHFEPLRHYAEVHLLLEPGENGSGLTFAADVSEDMLARNWQRLVLTHLEEKEHVGVLTGSPVTDMKITLVAGRAHLKHTEGGDFRQATYRALRQGLKQAQSVLLEPWYDFRLELPNECIGRAMNDIEGMSGKFDAPNRNGEMAVLTGIIPVASIRDYAKDVMAYTKGHGSLTCTLHGYLPCHNTEEVVEALGYDSERDLANPTGSVFCAHGAGFVVPWDQVMDYMHLESVLKPAKETEEWQPKQVYMQQQSREEEWIGTDEIDRILNQTYNANKREKSAPGRNVWKRSGGSSTNISPVTRTYTPPLSDKEYLLVDGYNVIFAWDELNELARDNVDGARGRLLDILCDYQGMRGCELIVVFDAYRVQGHKTEMYDYHNIHVVYTREAETADQYIEKFAHENGRKYRVTVATSDGLEQIIIRGAGCGLISARELEKEITRKRGEMLETYQAKREPEKKVHMAEHIPDEVAEAVRKADFHE